MKVAATLYMEEEAKKMADKEEKLSKFRESKADAAARVIQQMYYVFNVRIGVLPPPPALSWMTVL